MEKIILDTDIGDDIDDAFALALAVRSPEIELVGVTTVFRGSAARARMAKALLRTYERTDIPVYAGMDIPFIQELPVRPEDRVNEKGEFLPCQYEADMDLEQYETLHAVDYLIQRIHGAPGEITLVPIGPLTNIAAAIRRAPEIVQEVKGITLMGGYFHEDIPEWNIFCDPEAARIVFTSGISIRAVGLDVTLKCRMTPEMLDRLESMDEQPANLLNRLTKRWLKATGNDAPVLHDPLTVGTLLCPDFVKFEQVPVQVGLEKEVRARTLIREEAGPGTAVIEAAAKVDQEAYLKFFMERVFGME